MREAKVSRRDFLRISGGAGAALLFVGQIGGQFFSVPVAVASVGNPLDGGAVSKFQTPLLVPPAMPRAAVTTARGGKPVDCYEISVRQFEQQILPVGMPSTTVWGYGPVSAMTKRSVMIHNAPSLTIEARYDRPVRVRWINELVDERGNYLPHLLPVDPTLHWANPAGGVDGRDTRPTFEVTPARYAGPVPVVTHAHGAVGVGDESDGYAEAWYLPDAKNIPDEYATTGTWYEFFAAKAEASYGVTWGPGFVTYQYPNLSRATTTWYHDHTLGMTRLNVYAGPAGFFIVRGGPAGDSAVLDSRTGRPAILPGPSPRENDQFPPNKPYRDIPIAIQDRSFNTDGSLFYPDTRAFFDEIAGPYLPHTDVSPIWNPEFFGNALVVNGITWPFHVVVQRRYRFRVLNGCQSRFLILDFGQIPGVEAWAIGNEGGFLPETVNLSASNGNRLLIAPAERFDLLVDFTHVPVGNHVLTNVGPDEPFRGGMPGADFDVADPNTTGQIMQFRVVPATGVDASTPPEFLRLPAITPLGAATVIRPLVLLEEQSEFFDGPAAALLGTVRGDPNREPAQPTAHLWMDPVTENPEVGAIETWELYNATEDAHPMHIHEVHFEVLNRQAIDVHEETHEIRVLPESPVTSAEPWEAGVKDTVIAYPQQVTRVKARFDKAGQFVWHCHIVEHEDNEMMRPYRVGPAQPGAPGSGERSSGFA